MHLLFVLLRVFQKISTPSTIVVIVLIAIWSFFFEKEPKEAHWKPTAKDKDEDVK